MTQEIKWTTSDETKSIPFYFEVKNLWYDREYLLDHLNKVDDENWYEFDCGHIRWTVHEAFKARKECKNYHWNEFHYELAALFNPPITPDTMLYTSTPIGGTAPHQDRNRPAILNFAVRGEFGDNSPTTFYKDFNRDTLEEVVPYTKSEITNEYAPIMFPGPKIHGVENKSDELRTIITTCWRHSTWETIYNGIQTGSIINWDQNEKNKRIKFL